MATKKKAPTDVDHVTFVSPDRNLRLTHTPPRTSWHEGQPEKIPGKVFEFQHGALRLTDPGEIEWMFDHASFGLEFWDAASSPKKIDTGAIKDQIAKAAHEGDREALTALYEAESKGENRREILQAIQTSLGEIAAGDKQERVAA